MVTGSGSGINVNDAGLFLDLLERSDHLRLDIRGSSDHRPIGGSSIGAPRHEIRQKETPASNSAISAGPFLLGCEQWKASDEPLKRALRRGAAIS
jgi:hypothetical protein